MTVLLIGAAGFCIGFGAFIFRKLGFLRTDRILDPVIMILVATCTLVCQLSGESLPSIVTQCAWLAIGVSSLLKVLAAHRARS